MYPQVAVLALSMYPEDQFAIRMVKAGARGYLHKDSAPHVLEDAMRTIVSGKQYISAELTRLMIEEMAKDDNDLPHKNLSDREYEVLLFIGEGKSMTDIAAQLSLSIKTVSTYRSRILEKMRLKSNSDLVKYILLHDLSPGGADPTQSGS
jgi:two-component system invasion response regulator UvrY